MSVDLSFRAVALQLRSGTYMLEKPHDVEESQLAVTEKASFSQRAHRRKEVER